MSSLHPYKFIDDDVHWWYKIISTNVTSYVYYDDYDDVSLNE